MKDRISEKGISERMTRRKWVIDETQVKTTQGRIWSRLTRLTRVDRTRRKLSPNSQFMSPQSLVNKHLLTLRIVADDRRSIATEVE